MAVTYAADLAIWNMADGTCGIKPISPAAQPTAPAGRRAASKSPSPPKTATSISLMSLLVTNEMSARDPLS